MSIHSSTSPDVPVHTVVELATKVREGKFQRWLSLIAATASALSGIEVAYEHYRGSYSRRIMYTPVILSGALVAAGIAGFFNKRAARTLLRTVSGLTLADGATGFYFHVRGIQRKPGGWRLPIVNIVMGPPVFAPLLFGTSAYLGLIASLLQREDQPSGELALRPAHQDHWAYRLTGRYDSITWEQDVREGKYLIRFSK